MRKKKSVWITLAVAIILFVVFSLLGRVIAPSWVPEDSQASVTLDSTDTSIAANGSTPLPIGTYDVKEETITVKLTDDVYINAIVRTPVAPTHPDAEHPRLPAQIPGCMFITGAGLAKATDVYGDIAWDMASTGVATVVPDKRMDTYTWQKRDYVGMAHDYEKTLDVLESWSHVDPNGVGLYAESEGTWITPIIASERSEVAFSILVSAPVFTPREQITYAMDDYFRVLNVPYPTNQITSRVTTLDMGSIGPDYADFDVSPYLAKQTQPTLFVYGTNDLSMPTIEAPQTARKLMADNGNSNTQVRYYKGANHQMRVGDAKANKDLPLADNFSRDISCFAQNAKASTTKGWETPRVAGDGQPWQASAVHTDLSSNGIGGGLIHSVPRLAVMQIGGLLLLILSVLLIPVLHAARRRHIRRENAMAQLAANASPDSVTTGNIIVKYDVMSKEARKRPGFAKGMAQRLWACSSATFATTLVWLGYIVYTVLGVFKLTANSTLMVVWQNGARVLVAICTIMLANLLVHWVGTDIKHRQNPFERPAVAGRGHILWICVYMLGIILCFVMFMYWDLFLI